MSTRSYFVLVAAGALPLTPSMAFSQVECWAPGMPAPIVLSESARSGSAYLGKPFRYEVFGVAGKLTLGDKANNATVVNGLFKEKVLGGLLGYGGTVQSNAYVALQTSLTNIYPHRLSVTGNSPGNSVGPLQQYGQNWTLSDPRYRNAVNLTFHMPGSSLLGSLLPGIASPANYNLNPKGYFYVLGEYHEAPPVLSGTLALSSDEVLSGVPVNVSYNISRYETPIYRPPFLGLDLGNIGLTVLGTPPQSSTANPVVPILPTIVTGRSTDLNVTINLAAPQGQGWIKVSN
jgi:hypothetical protein